VAAKTCTVDTSKSLNVLNTDSLSPLDRGYRVVGAILSQHNIVLSPNRGT
jgi:hypothetical protein